MIAFNREMNYRIPMMVDGRGYQYSSPYNQTAVSRHKFTLLSPRPVRKLADPKQFSKYRDRHEQISGMVQQSPIDLKHF